MVIGHESVAATAATDVVPPSRTGRRVALRPVSSADHPFLYDLVVDEATGFRWRYRGFVPTPESFVNGLYQDVLVQFVVTTMNGEPIGHIAAYDVDFANRRVSFALAMRSVEAGLGGEAAILMLHYLFQTWQFEKICVEVAEYNLPQFERGLLRYFEPQGRFERHFWYAGRWWAQLHFACFRDGGAEGVSTLAESLSRTAGPTPTSTT